jgi:hypothetical protein
MSGRFSLSIFTIEIDGKPTIAFQTKRYSEAEPICEDEGLRAKLVRLAEYRPTPERSSAALLISSRVEVHQHPLRRTQ